MLSSSVAQEPARAISPLPSPGPASAAEPGAGSTPSSTWSTGWKARPAAAVRDVWPTISSASTSSCSTNWATCLSPRRRAAAVPSDQPALRAHVDHRHHQPRFRRMAERVRGCKDDDSTPRSSHPSLRDHRDRQRVLALQEPRLTDPRGLPRWANRQPPARAVPPLVGALRVTRGSLLFATWTSALRSLQRGVPFACRSGVPFPCRLTAGDRALVAREHGIAFFPQCLRKGF